MGKETTSKRSPLAEHHTAGDATEALSRLTRRTFIGAGLGSVALAVIGCDDDPTSTTSDAALDQEDRFEIADQTAEIDTTYDAELDAAEEFELLDDLSELDLAQDEVELDVRSYDFDPLLWNESVSMFPHGVQSGAMRPDSVLLWCFISDKAEKVVRVWLEEGSTGLGSIVDERPAVPDADGYCKVAVDGLEAGTWYRYGFFDDAANYRSTLGKVRTALAPDALETLTIGALVCTDWDKAPYKALTMTAAQDLDLIVHLGDMSYNDGAKSRADYRAKWFETLDIKGYRDLLPQAGMLITWDDHEIENNYDPETLDAAQLEAGKAAFFEALPVEEGPNSRLWTSYRWGMTAEIFLLDCRSERRPSTRNDADATYISAEQMAWLKEGLEDSPCHFKLILNSVPITNMPLLYDLVQADRWEGYDAQRTELLSFLETAAIPNVWFLSGDFHIGLVMRVEPTGYHHDTYEIAVGPSGNGPNPIAFLPHPPEQFDFVGQSAEFMTLLTFDPVANTVRVRFVDAVDDSVALDQEFPKP